MKQYITGTLFLIQFLFFVSSDAQEAVKTSYSEKTIPTYQWRGKDDINPSFRSTSQPMYSPYTTTYPYPTQDNLSKTKTDVVYKTMVLENEYLKVEVIPDLGGHVHAVYDKLTGKSIVYENKVLKPTLIGLRGAWTSGGIEFNTGPQGHTVTCLSPVEARFVDYPDGSKAIVVGNVEQVYHTQWAATIRLRPGKAFLEENIRIYNPTENKHLYYFWNCVAVENTDSLQLIYPMTLGQDHWGKTFYTWPMKDGKDQSWMKNYEQPSSTFSYRCDQDFYGSYDHALDRGLMAYANHNELEGKKSWTWGKGTWGARFQQCLTDDGSTYNEIQTGPLPTQADYGMLYPHQTVEWQEWWYPVRGTKGVAYSNKDVTVNILKDEKAKTATLLLNSTGNFNATCSIEGAGEQKVQLSPDKASRLIFTPKNLQDTFHITIRSGALQLADFKYPLPIPLRTAPEKPRELPADNTASGCWLRGIQCSKEGGEPVAKEWFEKALQKDENFTPAMTALAELEVGAGNYEAAKKLLAKCTKLNPDDGWAMYYLAKADMETGLEADALEMAYHAARCVESAAAGYSLAGNILIREGKFAEAATVLLEALSYNTADLTSSNLLAYALWKNGEPDKALQELYQIQQLDPLDMPSAYILSKLAKPDKGFNDRMNGHTEEVLDLADFFLSAGLKQEAMDVFKQYYVTVKKNELSPLPLYYVGILMNDETALTAAAAITPDYIFPNSLVAASILRKVCDREPKDWKARYYLGNFLFEHSQKDSAVKLWKEALTINDSYSVLHRNLGLVAWKVDKNYWQAIGHYEKALKCKPDDIPLFRDLATIYIENTQQYQKAKELLEEQVFKKNCTRADIISLLVRTYNLMGEYDKTIALLGAHSYNNWEGRGSLYTYYTEAHIGKGEQLFNKGKYDAAYKEFKTSIDYPMTLGPGLTTDPVTARSHYWMGMSLEKIGKKDEATKEYKLASEQSEKGSDENKKFALNAKEKLSGL